MQTAANNILAWFFQTYDSHRITVHINCFLHWFRISKIYFPVAIWHSIFHFRAKEKATLQ